MSDDAAPEITLHVGGVTDVGRLREVNEDSFLRDDEARVFAVADGMGGHRAGEVASSTALEAFQQHFQNGDPLPDAIEAANHAVFDMAQANPDMRGMGTTLTAVRVEGETAFIGHVGDSRAYLLRNGELTQVSEDHSLVEELVREGRLTPDEAAVHPQRSIITRAIGVDDDVDVATYEIDLRDGDRIMLCSDGLSSMVRDDVVLGILSRAADPQVAAQRLVDAANDAGGEDNITVLVLDVAGDTDAERQRAVAASDASLGDAGEPTGEWEQVPAHLDADADEADDDAAVPHRRWRRLALYLVPALVIVLVALAALGWYARRTYFVSLEGDRVALMQGVPDGFLFWDPTVEELTRLTPSMLSPADLGQVEDDLQFSSRSSAERFIERLQRKAVSTTTTTTTTEPGATTTTAASGDGGTTQ